MNVFNSRTGASDLLTGMSILLSSLARVRFVIATLGSEGSVLMSRPKPCDSSCPIDMSSAEEREVKNLDELFKKIDRDASRGWQQVWAFGVASDEISIAEKEVDEQGERAISLLVQAFQYRSVVPAEQGMVTAQVFYCPAYPLDPASIVDTTGILTFSLLPA